MAFAEEIEALQKGEEVRKSSKLLKLDPYFDEEDKLLRMRSRLTESDLTDQQKRPVILPSFKLKRLQDVNEDIVARLIFDLHCKNQHAGSDWCLNSLREQGFWLIGGKSTIRQITTKCVQCQKSIKKLSQQKMGEPPAYRLAHDIKPFSYVGMDAAGPLYLKEVNEEQPKVYVIVFTCLSSRAIHLELSPGLSTEAVIGCMRKLIARRGMIREILSDCHKTHVRCEVELRAILNEMNHQNFTWRYTPEHAPWYGAVYERMIRTIKETLRKVLGKKLLTFFELQVVLCEVEAMINDRPLTATSNDPMNWTAVTPSMLLNGYLLSQLPIGEMKISEAPKGSKEILKAWKKRVAVCEHAWNRWRKDYLFSLAQRPKWQTEKMNLQVGDLVLIATEKCSRGSWPMARVLATENVHNLRKNKSDQVRSVLLRLPSGKEIRRPIQHLVKLECD